MFDISFGEIGIIAVIAIVVVGPEKLPIVLKTIGTTLGKIRAMTEGVKAEVQRELNLTEIKSSFNDIKEIKDELLTVSQETENAMNLAQSRFKASMEESNLPYLATDKTIENFSFADIDDAKQDRNKAIQDLHHANPNHILHTPHSDEMAYDLSDDFSDFYTEENQIHGFGMHAKSQQYSVHSPPLSRFQKIIAAKQTELNIPLNSPAALVQQINQRYQNRYLLAEHELKEAYHARIHELTSHELPSIDILNY